MNIIPNQQTPKVEEIQGDVQEYIQDNLETLRELRDFASQQKNCIGLAANQVELFNGERLMLRAFIMKNLETKTFRVIINPVIKDYFGVSTERVEGCLTWKRKKIVANRCYSVGVSYYDIQGNFHDNKRQNGFVAQIWQHEVDHLNGVEERIEELTWPHTKEHTANRNDPCPCGSGKKFKKCCLK